MPRCTLLHLLYGRIFHRLKELGSDVDPSVFTTEQHFIVIAGMTEDGKFIIHDPMETNYLNADVAVRNCYDNGFDDFYLFLLLFSKIIFYISIIWDCNLYGFML